MSKKKKDNIEIQNYHNLTKQDLILESSCFNQKNFDVRQCQKVLTKLIHLFNRGEKFTDDETSSLFFSITKLFQSDDKTLKRLLYLAIKYMKDTPSLCMITNCITKDIKSNIANIKANAIRVLPLIIESQNDIQLERNLKIALCYKNEIVVESALLACLEIYRVKPEVIKRCMEEVGNIVLSKNKGNSHYKAFLLLQEFRKNDEISLLKLLQEMIKKVGIYNDVTVMYLIRAIGRIFLNKNVSLDDKTVMRFKNFLKSKIDVDNHLLFLEVAKVLCSIQSVDNQSLVPVVERLMNGLEVTNEVEKFAILEILKNLVQDSSRLSLFSETKVFHDLLNESNKNIPALVIGILIKITNISEIKEFLKKIYDFLDDLPTDLQQEVIKNCLFFTQKSTDTIELVFKFLKDCLKEKGELDFKLSIIKVCKNLLESFNEKNEEILEYFAEYIEDSYHDKITLSILNIFSQFLPQSYKPKFYLKFLINRLSLSSSVIRAATITCLGNIALKTDSLKKEIILLFNTLKNDKVEEEVRERCLEYLDMLENGQSVDVALEKEFSEDIVDGLIGALEKNFGEGNFDTSFIDFSSLRKKEKRGRERKKVVISDVKREGLVEFRGSNDLVDDETFDFIRTEEYFENFGELLLTTKFLKISDEDAEFFVQVRKHIFEENVSLEFKIKNNSENEIKNLKIDLEFDKEDGLDMINSFSQDLILPNDCGKSFINFKKENLLITQEFNGVLEFEVIIKEDEEIVNEYEDEFPLDPFEVKTNDFFNKYPFEVKKEDFENILKNFKNEESQKQNYQLDFETINTAIDELSKIFGLSLCSDSVNVDLDKNFHELYLMGLYNNYVPVLIHAKIGFDKNKKCIVCLVTHSADEELSIELLDI